MKIFLNKAFAILCISTIPFHLSAQEEGILKYPQLSEDALQIAYQFFQYDKHVPLNVRVISKVENEEYVREKIVFDGFRNSQVVGYLAIPKIGTAPYPCVLQMHGGVSIGKESFWSESPYTDRLVTEGLIKSGIAVLTLDAQTFGERNMINDFKTVADDIWGDKQVYKALHTFIESTIEYRRALDYLESRTEISMTAIGSNGLSLGGLMTLYLSAVDSRIKAAAPGVVPLNIFEDGVNKMYDWELPSALSPWHYARSIEGKPIFLMMSNTDPFYTKNEAQEFYKLFNGDSNSFKFYDCEGGHCLPEEHAKDVVQWFTERLK